VSAHRCRRLLDDVAAQRRERARDGADRRLGHPKVGERVGEVLDDAVERGIGDRAPAMGLRTVMLRTGVVLSGKGGALPKMLPPFKLGVGGRLGSGQQWMSWIAIEDVVGIIRHAIANEQVTGPVNVVAPNPVRNKEFTRLLAGMLHRPAIFPAPAFVLRLAMGEMADAILLSSDRVKPERMLAAGYKFRFEILEPALRAAVLSRM